MISLRRHIVLYYAFPLNSRHDLSRNSSFFTFKLNLMPFNMWSPRAAPHLTLGLALGSVGMTIKQGAKLTIEARSNWKFLGCYTDNVSGRALPNGEAVHGGTAVLTNELCQSTCLAAGFSIAGTEYGGECCKLIFKMKLTPIDDNHFSGCGNSILNGGGPAPNGNVSCDMACNGNSAETCGGSNRLDVYQYSSSASAGTGKRGVAYTNNNPGGNAEYANLFRGYNTVTWGYDWGYPSDNLDPSFELYAEPLSLVL